MALSYSLQGNNGNPYRDEIGTETSNEVLLNSGETTAPVIYEVRRKDRSDATIRVRSGAAATALISSCTAAQLSIRLLGSTKYQFRIKTAAGVWSDWLNFKTRDKKFSTPTTAGYLSYEEAAVTNGARINVTNSSKSIETVTATGARVVVTDTGYNDTSSITKNRRGETVTNVTGEIKTAHGARYGQL